MIKLQQKEGKKEGVLMTSTPLNMGVGEIFEVF